MLVSFPLVHCLPDISSMHVPDMHAASHAWDCAAAKNAGFLTAYTTTYEFDECRDIFGTSDIVTPDLVTLGKAIVEKYGKK